LGTLHGLKKDEIDRLFPPTIDERIAEDENEKLSDNKVVGVLREDDHNVHLEIHNKASDTASKFAHIETHKKALMIKKVSPELFPEEPEATDFQAPGTQKLLPPEIAGESESIAPSSSPGRATPSE